MVEMGSVIEHGTVIGNVSRTHHPCAPCGALVESCGHLQPKKREIGRAEHRAAKRAAMLRERALLGLEPIEQGWTR
jgi:hypothetical protein